MCKHKMFRRKSKCDRCNNTLDNIIYALKEKSCHLHGTLEVYPCIYCSIAEESRILSIEKRVKNITADKVRECIKTSICPIHENMRYGEKGFGDRWNIGDIYRGNCVYCQIKSTLFFAEEEFKKYDDKLKSLQIELSSTKSINEELSEENNKLKMLCSLPIIEIGKFYYNELGEKCYVFKFNEETETFEYFNFSSGENVKYINKSGHYTDKSGFQLVKICEKQEI